MPEERRTIKASPTKRFFIKIIVKDIDLIDAILDLVDNAIDGYIKKQLSGKRKIAINFSSDEFVIKDNCGGIEKEETYNNVFRFGLAKVSEKKERTIGVFNIGLKRSIFKIGENILIESDDGKDLFSIRIDKEWLESEQSWDLHFDKEEDSKGKPFTKITIKDIFPNIADEFTSTTFENRLINTIRNTYSVFLEDRVNIEVSGSAIEPYDFSFLFEKEGERVFVPLHKKYNFDGVETEIYAGYTPIGIGTERVFGWYLFCNDRLVVRNDTSGRTGWGWDGERKYHYPEDNRFLGLVFFRSEKPELLPWRTTKSGIQEDSRIYRTALVEMRAITKRFVDVIRETGRKKDPETGETIGKAYFEGIRTKLRKEIIEQTDEKIPDILGEAIETLPKKTIIQYLKPVSLVKKVKEKLKNTYMSNREAGEKTFEYYVKMEEIVDE